MTSYPTSLDSYATKIDGDVLHASHVDNLQDAVVAVETEIGTGLRGTKTDLATRLGVSLNTDGTIKANIINTNNIVLAGLNSAAIASGSIQNYHLAPGVGGGSFSVNSGAVTIPNLSDSLTLTWAVSGSVIKGNVVGGVGSQGSTGAQGPPGPAYTNTTSTFLCPAVGSSIGALVASSGSSLFAILDYALVSDGVKTFFSQVTGVVPGTVTLKRLQDTGLTNVAVTNYSFTSGITTVSKSAVPIPTVLQRAYQYCGTATPSASGTLLPIGFVLPAHPASGSVVLSYTLQSISLYMPLTPGGLGQDIKIYKNGSLLQMITLSASGTSGLFSASGSLVTNDILSFGTGTNTSLNPFTLAANLSSTY